ncbi:MAG: hypothetical protein ACRBFS_06135 [Aureispira sp.]
MNQLYCLFLLLLLTTCQSTPDQLLYNDLAAYHLQGAVKSLIQQRYRAARHTQQPIKGKLLLPEDQGEQFYEYQGVASNTKTWFDEEGKMTKQSTFDREGYEIRYTLKAGAITTIYDYQDQLLSHWKADAPDFPTWIEVFGTEQELLAKTIVTYKDKQNKARGYTHTNYDKDGKLLGSTIYELDADFRLERVTTSYQEDPYYEKSTVLEEIEYDENNHPRQVKLQALGVIRTITLEYELDAQKNWTKAIEYEGGIPVAILERTILYY